MTRFVFPLSLLFLGAATLWCLAPGLGGGFLFDDFVNLPALGEFGSVHDLQTLALYLTSGLGDPIGRPLSMFSFLLDATTWPADPRPFLRTNIVLHVFNGVLLAFFLARLGRDSGMTEGSARLAAFLGAAMWMLHPLLLSTTLYVVQRESMLSTTFVLLGLLCWLRGRAAFAFGSTRKGTALLFAASWICTGLAMLCKANGVVLPLLLVVMESTLPFRGESVHRNFLLTRRALLAIPIAITLVGLSSMVPKFAADASELRPWTLWQRTVTEPRVLLDYLKLIFLPRPISGGVFHDNFMVSDGLLSPPSTAIALLIVGVSIAAAWCARRKWPLLSFSILFFFAAHSLEASFIPLELYFEHRNYLPTLVLFWPIAAWLSSGVTLHRLRLGMAYLLVGVLGLETHVGAEVWGNSASLAAIWAAHNPESSRAQAYYSQFEMALGHYADARTRLFGALQEHPQDVQLAFNLADAECGLGGVTPSTLDSLKRALAARGNSALIDFSWLSSHVTSNSSCDGLDLSTIQLLVGVARANPQFADKPGRQQDFDHIQGLIDLHRGDPQKAFMDFENALERWPRASLALSQAVILANGGRVDLALRHLKSFEVNPQIPVSWGISPAHLHAWLLYRSQYWTLELQHLKRVLVDECRKDDSSCRGE